MKMFNAPLSLEGWIGRLEYFISFLLWIGIDSLFYVPASSSSVSMISNIISIVLCFFILLQGAKRCHDIGKSSWWQLVPFFWLWLLVAMSDKGENEYGSCNI